MLFTYKNVSTLNEGYNFAKVMDLPPKHTWVMGGQMDKRLESKINTFNHLVTHISFSKNVKAQISFGDKGQRFKIVYLKTKIR
jgi:hypothetical protein